MLNQLKIHILFNLFLAAILFGQSNKNDIEIFVNQVGYLPQFVKYATVTGKADSFQLYSLDNCKPVLTKKLSQVQYWSPSDEYVQIADFTEVKKEGKYKIIVNGKESFKFEISKNVFSKISNSAIKSFYYQRASTELPEKFAGKWKRKCGLPDTAVIIHSSAASKERPPGTIVSAPMGWFDAGDYNKYIVNSSIAVYTLLLLYDLYPGYFNLAEINIPEKNNELPDILDEILWNVRWMLKMQDPTDGGVYHKLTCKQFQPYVMPDEVKAKRYIVGKSTEASLNFSAALAHLSVTIERSKLPLNKLKDSCLTAAKKAWTWAVKNPNKHFSNPSDILTGEYRDADVTDNFFWAGMELFNATNDTSYLRNLNKINQMTVDSIYWAHVANLGMLTALNEDSSLHNLIYNVPEINKIFKNAVENIYKNNINSPYKISLKKFKWGSNANLLNETLMLIAGYKLYNEKKYLNAAITNIDYILGRNPTGYCYVTGFGEKPPMYIHHRVCEADNIKEPIPGFVVGGPNHYYLVDCGKEKYPSLLPAKCYLDDVCSYSTNEIAINWNASLAFVLMALDDISKY